MRRRLSAKAEKTTGLRRETVNMDSHALCALITDSLPREEPDMSKETFYVTPTQAARILGVHVNTIHSWIDAGRLSATVKEVVETRTLIPTSSLKNAFKVRCRVCGRVFTAKRPLQAKFCSQKHRDMWHTRRRRH